MLQRAASNAYSWWWASHIRTKQSKWLEQSLQDMEEKVSYVLSLIQEDGDSFAKRAEMYYKHRPELISFVEETVRAYRALAERYDKLSTDLQKAHTTIASVCPDQVPYDMEEDDYDFTTRAPPKMPKRGPSEVPKLPKLPNKDLKSVITTASKKIQAKKSFKPDRSSNHVIPKSGLTKEAAIDEIDKLQKDILAMQTMKEFLKSSYESGLAKYWDTENKIMEMQQRVSGLQDEFQVGKVIEDDDARALMAEAALKSCQEALEKLQEKQDKSSEDARLEHQKLEDARHKIISLKHKFLPGEAREHEKEAEEESKKDSNQETEKEIEAKIKESFVGLSKEPLTVSELAETIDQLVNKVVSLESSVSSQTALIDRLRTETDDLQKQICNLEDDKAMLIDGSLNLDKKLKDMEEKLHGVQDLDQNVENQNNSLKAHFTEARCSLEHLAEKIHDVEPHNEVKIKGSSKVENSNSEETMGKKENHCTNDDGVKNAGTSIVDITSTSEVLVKKTEKGDEKSNSRTKNKNEELIEAVEVNDGVKNAEIPQKSGDAGERSADITSTNSLVVKNSEKGDEISNSASESERKEVKEASNESTKPKILTRESEHQMLSEVKDGVKNAEISEKTGEVEKIDADITSTNDVVVKNLEKGDQISNSNSKSQKEEEVKEAKIESTNPKIVTPPNEHQKLTDDVPHSESHERDREKEDMNWQQMLLSGVEDKEKILLKEYITILRNYKDTRRKLTEEEKKNQEILFEMTIQVRQLKTGMMKKENEIKWLKQKLKILQDVVGTDKVENWPEEVPSEDKEDDDIKIISIDESQPLSAIEEKLRMDIDGILDENLDFWLRFSTAFHQVQKFKNAVEDLQEEIVKVKAKGTEKKSSTSTSTFTTDLRSEVRPIYKHLKEIQNELTVWLEQSASLKDELQRRCLSLSTIQEEITMALRQGMEEEEIKFSTHQAAKFQGEILNMQQENRKVDEELQAGLDHVTALKLETDKTLGRLEEEFGLSENHNQTNMGRTSSKPGIPLRSFIFGVKAKKQKPSIFACIHHHKKFGVSKSPHL